MKRVIQKKYWHWGVVAVMMCLAFISALTGCGSPVSQSGPTATASRTPTETKIPPTTSPSLTPSPSHTSPPTPTLIGDLDPNRFPCVWNICPFRSDYNSARRRIRGLTHGLFGMAWTMDGDYNWGSPDPDIGQITLIDPIDTDLWLSTLPTYLGMPNEIRIAGYYSLNGYREDTTIFIFWDEHGTVAEYQVGSELPYLPESYCQENVDIMPAFVYLWHPEEVDSAPVRGQNRTLMYQSSPIEYGWEMSIEEFMGRVENARSCSSTPEPGSDQHAEYSFDEIDEHEFPCLWGLCPSSSNVTDMHLLLDEVSDISQEGNHVTAIARSPLGFHAMEFYLEGQEIMQTVLIFPEHENLRLLELPALIGYPSEIEIVIQQDSPVTGGDEARLLTLWQDIGVGGQYWLIPDNVTGSDALICFTDAESYLVGLYLWSPQHPDFMPSLHLSQSLTAEIMSLEEAFGLTIEEFFAMIDEGVGCFRAQLSGDG